MGDKGKQMGQESVLTADLLLERCSPIGGL